MPDQQKTATIYVGSFKPPHKGHLHIAKTILKEMTKQTDKSTLYIVISAKTREPCTNFKAEDSKNIWNIYLNTLGSLKERVRIMISRLSSPTQTAYGFIKRVFKKGDKVYLIKSVKNKNDKRYSSFENLKGVGIEKMVLPGYKNLHSSTLRNLVKKGERAKFLKEYMPSGLTNAQKQKIWNTMKKKCK